MSDSDRILTDLRRIVGDRDNAGPASPDAITAAESELGVTFPPSYRVFLAHFGAGGIAAPYDIIGLPNSRASDPSPPMWSHVLDVAARLRRHSDHQPTLIPISSDGCGVNIYLDASRTDDSGECLVLARGPGFDDIDIAPSFLAFAELALSGDPLAQT